MFLGRTGQGPLRLAWDTNILIDYEVHGKAMWEENDQPFEPDIAKDEYREELLTLQVIVQAWMLQSFAVVGECCGLRNRPQSAPTRSAMASAEEPAGLRTA